MAKGKSSDKKHKQPELMAKPAQAVTTSAVATSAASPPGVSIAPIRGRWPLLVAVGGIYFAWLIFLLVLAWQS